MAGELHQVNHGDPTEGPASAASMRDSQRRASGHEIARSIRASIGYLSHHLSRSGCFDYVYDTGTRQDSSKRNLLAHAGTTVVLYRLVGSRFDDTTLEGTASRAWSYLCRFLQPSKRRSGGGTRLVDGRIAKLGGTALALLALAARIDRYHSAGDDEVRLLAQLARYLASQQEEDGHFISQVDAMTGERVPLQSLCYPGVAVLALCAAYRITGHVEQLERAVRGARHLVREPLVDCPTALAPTDHWLMMALAELHVLAPDPAWAEHLRALSAHLVAPPLSAGSKDAENRSWLHARTTREVAASVEGLLAALAVERHVGERARAASLLRRILEGLGRCYERQLGGECESGIDPRIRGGFVSGPSCTVIRLDYVHYPLAASFGALQLVARTSAPASYAAEHGSLRLPHPASAPSPELAAGPARSLRFEAYLLATNSLVVISPAPSRREWMESTSDHFANRCLPLIMANQAGWFLALREAVEMEWTGVDGIDQVCVFGSERVQKIVTSHFGAGIVTFSMQMLFRTELGYNLLVRGPANMPKDGIAPLEGLVETDWTAATFTMNWRLTRPGHRVGFAAGEPFGMLVPMRRGELDEFAPEYRTLHDNRELRKRYYAWNEDRKQFNYKLKTGDKEAVQLGWQRHYLLGRDSGGEPVAEQHQTKMQVRPFEKLRKT